MPTSPAGSNPFKAQALRGACRTGGFTLIELLVTLALIAVVSALTVPALASRLLEPPGMRAARAAAGLAVQARRTAAENGEPASLRWLPDTRRLELVTASSTRPLAAFGVPPDVAVTPVGFVTPDHTIDFSRPTEPATEIVFFPGGGSTGGRLDVGPLSRTAGAAGARSFTVSVDPLTGYVTREAR